MKIFEVVGFFLGAALVRFILIALGLTGVVELLHFFGIYTIGAWTVAWSLKLAWHLLIASYLIRGIFCDNSGINSQED